MSKTKKGQVFVLLAPDFQEIDIVTLVSTLRQQGIPVTLVGLTAGPIRGSRGVTLMPDLSFNSINDACPDAVIIPGGVYSVQQLGADPRVHALLRQVIARQRYIVAIGEAQGLLQDLAVQEQAAQFSSTFSVYGPPAGERRDAQDHPDDPTSIDQYIVSILAAPPG